MFWFFQFMLHDVDPSFGLGAMHAKVANIDRRAETFPENLDYQLNKGRCSAEPGFWWSSRKRWDKAIESLEAAIAEFRKQREKVTNPQGRNWVEDRLSVWLAELVKSYDNADRAADADRVLAEAAADWQKLSADHPDVSVYRKCLANFHAALGRWLADNNQPAKTKSHYEAALAVREKLVADFPKDNSFRFELAERTTVTQFFCKSMIKLPPFSSMNMR